LGGSITKVACMSDLLQERLLPIDTIRGVASTRGGATGIVSMSYGTEFGRGLEIEVVTDRGKVSWTPKDGVSWTVKSESGEKSEGNEKVEMGTSVNVEFRTFAKCVREKKLDWTIDPAEALEDLRLLEAFFRSGEAGGSPKDV
jgi:predicted dehydrogenase